MHRLALVAVVPSLAAACAACASSPAASRPQHAHHEGHGGHADHHGHDHDHHEHRFDDAESWAKSFDDPARDAWQKPDEVIAALALDGVGSVADIGAGTGYFTMRLAKARPQATVFAVDVEPDMVRYLGERAAKEGLANVRPLLAQAGVSGLPQAVDLVLVVDTYHHIAERPAYFARLASSIAPGGRLVIIDFTAASPIGPPPEYRLTPAQVTSELDQAGYVLVREATFLPHQYFLEYRRK